MIHKYDPQCRRLTASFDLAGNQLSEVRLEAATPNPAAGIWDNITRVIPVAGGNLLVEWNHVEQTGRTRRSVRFLSLHGSAGYKLTDAVIPAPGTAVLFSDETDICYTLHKRDSTGLSFDLIRSSVTTSTQ